MNILVSYSELLISFLNNNIGLSVFYSPEEAAEMREVHMNCEFAASWV